VRRSELFRLQWDDVDFEHSMVTLRETKGGKSETIPVSAEALDVLRGMPVMSEYVFPSPSGGMRTSIRDTWLRVKEQAGLPAGFRFHGLRHSYASWLVSHGVDLATVQRLMTHKHASTTERYAHLLPGRLKEAAETGGKILNRPGRGPKSAKRTSSSKPSRGE
jgi:integrase